ncbi:MAG: hypothetical protein GY851_25570 [bacterium]|nr:hypothetical protein [bacterium]
MSFSHRNHPGNRVGYRFHEHAPLIFGDVPDSDDGETAEASEQEAAFSKRPGIVINTIHVREEGWCSQDWTYYIVPVADGFEMLWVVEAHETGLNEFYCVQQCFRMSGVTNQDWRRKIAETPAFSEFDLWAKQEAEGTAFTSLSRVRCGDQWVSMSATRDNVGYRTPLGVYLDTRRSDGDIKTVGLEPYKPILADEESDHGLITRMDMAGEWLCGLYWERTTHVTDHHPADCLHSVVNLGPIPPRGKRAIRGKIYWMKGSLDDLYRHWERDFGKAK